MPTLILATLLVFFAMSKAGGNPVSSILGENASAEQVREIEHQLGLDRAFLLRYADYMAGVFKGDMGVSYVTGEDVFRTFFRYFPWTLCLSFLSLSIAIALAVPLGISAAVHKGSFKDTICTVVSLIGTSMPSFWLSLILILVFSYRLKLLPSGGSGSIRHLILPSVSIAFALVGLIARMTRNSMLDSMDKDYVVFARAKGLSERRVIYKYCLRNAMTGIMTSIGQQASFIMTGSVLAETVFSIPGVGRLIFQSIASRDIPMVTGAIVLCCLIMSLVNLLCDILIAFFDPRIRDNLVQGQMA